MQKNARSLNNILKSGFTLREGDRFKTVKSDYYNYFFDKKTGFFARYGKGKNDDPDYSYFGPEIADIEITTKCNGVPDCSGKKVLCKWCYKGNTPRGKNMSFETFKNIFNKFNKSLTQIAFGGDSECTSNPDIWKMMEYCRKNGVIPNITVANVSNTIADKLAYHCGAIAVSRYANKEVCYNSIKKLSRAGANQINIHIMLSMESLSWAWETLKDRMTDPRLKKLNAIVFLSLKQKGRGKNHHIVPQEEYNKLVSFALKNNISIGFDSCSAPKFLKSVENNKKFNFFKTFVEPCESQLFSIYLNVDGKVFPCSFCEGEKGHRGIDMTKDINFMKDVWYSKPVVSWRKKLLGNIDKSINCRSCPAFTV